MSVHIWTWDPQVSHVHHCLKLKKKPQIVFHFSFLFYVVPLLYSNVSEFSQLGKIFKSAAKKKALKVLGFLWEKENNNSFFFSKSLFSFLWTLQKETLHIEWLLLVFFYLSLKLTLRVCPWFKNYVLVTFLKLKVINFWLNIKTVPKHYSNCI